MGKRGRQFVTGQGGYMAAWVHVQSSLLPAQPLPTANALLGPSSLSLVLFLIVTQSSQSPLLPLAWV